MQQLVKNEGLVCLEREVDEILPKDTKMGHMVFAEFEMTVRRTLKYFHRRTWRVTGRFDTKTLRYESSRYKFLQIRGRERLR